MFRLKLRRIDIERFASSFRHHSVTWPRNMKNYTQKKAPIKPPEDNFCAKDKRCGFISEKPGLERESTQNRAERPVSKRFRHVVLLSFERAVMDVKGSVYKGCFKKNRCRNSSTSTARQLRSSQPSFHLRYSSSKRTRM